MDATIDITPDVKKYSVILGFSMIAIFILPCVLLAFFSKYLVRSSPTPKPKLEKTPKSMTSMTTVATELPDHLLQYPHNKLTFMEKLGGGFGTCCELWKAAIPTEQTKRTSRSGIKSEEQSSDGLVCIRRPQEGQELHFQCLKSELNLLSSITPHPHFLNLVGFTINFRRPSFRISGSSQSDPAGLLFEYPWYGRLFSFVGTKRRAVMSGTRGKWAALEQNATTGGHRDSLLETYTCNYAVTGSDACRPFLKPLGDPLDEIDLCVFALQIASAMEYLVSKKLLHKRLCSESIAVSREFYLKVADIEFELPHLHKSTPPNIPVIKKSPSGRRMFRWDAPEVLNNKGHTEKSEVWRFGMTLWEIVSLGDTPFEDTPDSSSLLNNLLSGHHAQKPKGCPDHLYQIMECCWSVHPDQRPTFNKVMEMLLAEYEFVAGFGRKEAVNPLDTTSRTSSTEGTSSSPDRLIPPVTVEDYKDSPSEYRRGSFPLTYRAGGARNSLLNSNSTTTKI